MTIYGRRDVFPSGDRPAVTATTCRVRLDRLVVVVVVRLPPSLFRPTRRTSPGSGFPRPSRNLTGAESGSEAYLSPPRTRAGLTVVPFQLTDLNPIVRTTITFFFSITVGLRSKTANKRSRENSGISRSLSKELSDHLHYSDPSVRLLCTAQKHDR